MKTLRPHVGTEIKSIVFIHFLLSYTILTMTLEWVGVLIAPISEMKERRLTAVR